MHTYDITILTDRRYLHPEKIDWYIQNILDEDKLVTEALEKKGYRVHRINWDADFNFKHTRAVLFRATWDYFDRAQEFSVWLDKVKTQTELINDLKTIRWSMDKHYLQDLEKQGIRIPKTIFIEKGDKRTLQELINVVKAWKNWILKPAISGAARHTYKLNASNIDAHEDVFAKLIAEEAMLIQEYQTQITTKGEVAFMVFGGVFSHAILKKAKAGDFRVQDDFGGTVHDYAPTQEEIDFAESVVKNCGYNPVYARVDVIWDNEDQLCVSELELIEPELWFRKSDRAAELLANAIEKKFSSTVKKA